MTYLRCSSDSRTRLPVGELLLGQARGLFHLAQLEAGLLGGARAQQGGVGLVFLAAAEEPARRLADHEAAEDEEQARGQRDPEDSAPGVIFEVEERLGAGGLGDRLHAIAEVDAHERGSEDAQGEQPLEDAGALAAAGGGEALSQVERDDDADESAAHALQETAEEERAVALREGDDGDAEDEGEAAEDHERLAAHPVGEQAGEEGGEDGAQQHRGDDDGELRGGQMRGGLEVGKRTADDAHVDAVEQAAETGNQEKKAGVTALGGGVGGGGCGVRGGHRFWLPFSDSSAGSITIAISMQ